MPIPASISDLSTTPGSNSPSGSDSPTVLDDHQRTAYAFIRTLSDSKAAITDTVLLTGNQTIEGVKTFSSTPVVPDDSFTFAKLQNVATARLLGRTTAASGNIEELTQAQAAEIVGHAGQVAAFAMNTAPTGWLKANGAAINRTTYAALFTAIGTTFGAGDGSTTFNLPDLRGEFIRGWDDSRGVDSGRAFGSSQTDALQGHRHTVTLESSAPGGAGSTGGNIGSIVKTSSDPVTDGANGTPRTAAETRPRNIALLACIKF